MAEEEQVDGLVREEVRAVGVEPFVLGAAEVRVGRSVRGAAGGGEVSGQGDAAVGVDLAEKCGGPACREEPLQALVAVVAGPQAVAVADEAAEAVVVAADGRAVHLHAELGFEVAEGPQVVVADVKMNGDAGIGDAGDGAQQPDVAAGNGPAVFEPKVKHIPDQVDFGGRLSGHKVGAGSGRLEPCHKPPFPLPGRHGGVDAEVQIRGQRDARNARDRGAVSGGALQGALLTQGRGGSCRRPCRRGRGGRSRECSSPRRPQQRRCASRRGR